ncbi:acyl transferase domain-containing protein [Kibdelosporangium banguiense]|uniref:Acyl transferase domain-containing protein n=1 Tax=Kibdelosporangium banguiense TaxID=1365924 RepID=A0ABS4TXM2_9PSEU|nr:type I polyketide synthase [Kibdelosporangium banguiense]MBP2329145.1 acyl transferase domain-containing protein [Kibdelosporangium banguiense]
MADKEQVVDYLKRVTADLRRTRQRVRDLEDAAREPIAIVGMSCRFPGKAATPEAFWELLADGVDATSEYPADRGWPVVPGGRGGFLDGATDFAAGFFGVSPREALEMDPQQRVLLEASWEVFERAGIDPGTVRGSKTGVFIGVNGSDYGALLNHARHESLGYLLTGTAASVVSGRVAFTFGFEGPAVTVDTACSASLVSLHLAAQALRGGECSLALVGGVTVMSTPGVFDEFGKQGGMSGDGRCKAFSAGADGTAWGEGVGLLLVERLSDAVRNGHEVLAVVRGSAVNQDGASNGLTAPNGPSQQRVIEDALSAAALAASDVDVVEAHGTGTTLGDPIEAQALLATYGRERDIPLWLGSVKSNIGHTQAAAGMAGVIKMVLAMRHGVVPQTLHVDEPTPHVDWAAGAVELVTERVSWPETGRLRRAAVSSFGISGTNAHVILEQAAEAVETSIVDAEAAVGPLPWVLSARTPAEVHLQAAKLAEFLASGDIEDAAVVAALVRRPEFEHRTVVVARDRAERDQELAALAHQERTGRGTVHGVARPDAALAVVFSGQGSQWAGMGKQWYDEIPAFASAFDAVCAVVDRQLDVPLAEVVFGSDETLLGQTKYAQVALFAVEVALFRALAAWGVQPNVLLGHSVGEIAAAHVAGVLTLVDASTLAVVRGALMQDLPAGGVMLAVRGTEPEVVDWLGGSDQVSIAAVNGPDAVVVSGTAEAVQEVARRAEDAGRRTRYLKVSHAFHSPCMEPMLAAFETVLGGLNWAPPEIPIISTVTGALLTADEVMSSAYWVRQARDTVRFRDAVAALEVDAVVELGPHAVLTSSIVDSVVGEKPVVTAVGHRDRPQTAELLRAVGALWAGGVSVDWQAVLPAVTERVALPTYAFDRKRFWPTVSHRANDVAAAGLTSVDHPLLAAAVSMADGDTVVLTGRMSPLTHPWLADHAVLGSVLLPGTAFVELVLRAGQDVGCPSLRDLIVETPLVLGTGATQLQVVVGAADADGERAVSVHSRPDDSQAAWTCHANAVVRPATDAPGEFVAVTGAWPPPGATQVDIDGFYPALRGMGYEYGLAFQGLQAVWRRGHEIFAEVTLPDEPTGFGIHPALLDAALHPMGVLDGADTARVPFAWTGVRLLATGARSVRVAITAVADDVVRVRVADQAGAPVIGIDELVVRPVTRIQAATPMVADALFIRRWEPFVPLDEPVDDTGLFLLDCASLPVTATDEPTRAEETVAAVLARVREWLADDNQAGTRLAVLTRLGAVVGDDDRVDLAQAAVIGLVRSASAEHPDRFLIADLDTEILPEGALAAAVAAAEPEIAIRGGAVFVPRLARASAAPAEPEAPVVTGPVLVTGGTGVIGAAVAEHLVTTHGVTSLVLASQRGPDAPRAEEQAARLRDLGADVRLVACDLADREQVTALVAGIPGLRGVVHSAGIVDDGVVEAITPERLGRVMRPKAHAAWYLHELTADMDLDLFALFSSAAGVFGSPGQANYAAANTFLDALAEHRRAAGVPAHSMAWGLWAETSGMTGTLGETDRRRLTRAGLRPLSGAEGGALFDAALRLPGPVAVPIRLDLRGPGRPPALLRGLVAAPLPSLTVRGVESWHDRMRSAPDLQLALTDAVREEAAIVLGHGTAADIAAGESFSRLGFDSLTAVELRNRLTDLTGIRLPATLVFDYPSPEALAAFLGEQFGPATVELQARGPVPSDEPIAIIGMSCRYPGGVRSPEDLWDLVVQRREGLGPFPDDRGWDVAALHDGDGTELGTTYVREGGFLYDAAEFDPTFFGISPREAAVMDPQHRLLLELSWEVVERAGIDITELRGSRTGMYGGLMYHDYAARLRSIPADAAGFLSGSAGSVATGRVAYSFGFEGPAVTVDTACSSSLVALDMAVSALRRGEIDFAVAGGVTVLATPTAFTEFGRQRGLAPDGRCKAFSATADGTAWSEGIGLLMVERLSDARRNGHPVLAVVRGSSVNQDGASNGMTAPNGPSQQRVIRRALAGAGLEPSDVDVVEAHGTGTKLGDPIEAQAVLATYGQRPADRPVLLGSVKSNIGHTQAAAGTAGVIKMVMAMRHGLVPPTLHVTEPSTHVDWTAGAVELATDTVPWPETGQPRRAAVSSFGISGTNAHVVLEQAPEAEPRPPAPVVLEPGPVLPWVLSAKSAAGLAGQAERLRDNKGTAASLTDVAAALAGSRTALDHRAVVLAPDRDGFVAGLDALARHEYGDTVLGGMARTGTKVAFVFPGDGTRWATDLLTRSPVFAQSMARCGKALESAVDWSLLDVLDCGDVPEAARWAVMVSMADLWRALGVQPAALIGHGIVAACVSGELSLDDAARRITSGEPWATSFDDEVRAALDAGIDMFLAMSPHPAPAVERLADGPVRVLGSGDVLRTAAILWTNGVPVDWPALLPRQTAEVDLPTYAFQRQRYWLDAPEEPGDVTGAGLDPAGHPLLAGAVVLAEADTLLLTGRLSAGTHPWLADHAVHGTVLVPGSVFLDWALHAGERLGCPAIAELTTEAPLVLDPDAAVQVQVHASAPDPDGTRALTVHSRPEPADGAAWTCHARAALSPASTDPAGADALATWPPPGAEQVELGDFYGDLVEHGYDYGPAFRGLRAAWRRGTDVFAEVVLPGGSDGYGLHPALLDAAMHALGIGPFLDRDPGHVLLPFTWTQVRRHAPATAARVRISAVDKDTVSVHLADADGPVAEIGRVALMPVPVDRLAGVSRQKAARPAAASDEQRTRIRAAAQEERTTLLVQFIQNELAVLRRDATPVHPDAEFLDVGVDSMLGIELTRRLDALLGLRLPKTTMFEHPTTALLADHLAALVDAEPVADAVPQPVRQPAANPFAGIEDLYRESYRVGLAGSAGMQLIRAASRLRESFTADAIAEHVPEPVTLAQGGSRTKLVCLPAITATAGPVQYARLSQVVKGSRDVVVLPNPGYADGESLPDSFRTFIGLQVYALRAAVGEDPFVLLGHSAGGLIAYAVAGAAERAGLRPAGVVLLDTFGADARFSDRTTEVMLDGLFAREHILGADALSGVRLTAMGRYYTLMDECELDLVESRTFFLRAEDPMPHQDEGTGDWRATWPFPHTLGSTTGDHFTVMEDHVAETVAAVERWLTSHGI